MIMYEIFDGFCQLPTWDTSHPADRERFRSALLDAVHMPGFSPEAMGAYIEANCAELIWPKSEDELKRVIAGLVEEARAELLRVQG